MRRSLTVLLVSLLMAIAPAAGGVLTATAAPNGAAGGPAAGDLRLHQLQARGTHNSYHLDPGTSFGDQVGWDYSHLPLSRQLDEQGVRQLELDVHWNWARQDFEVYHAWFGDDRSTCELLRDCLAEVRSWSDANPAHHPIMIMIEPKDGGPPRDQGLPEDGDPFTHPIGEEEYGTLDTVLLDAFDGAVGDGGRVFTPADVTRPGLTLRESILGHGWPRIDHLRGHVLYVVDGRTSDERPTQYQHGFDYSRGFTSLVGRAAFVQADVHHPVAAFVNRDGRRLPGESRFDRIRRVVEQGFLVRDLGGSSDAEASQAFYEASKAAGSQFISTDYPEDLHLTDDPARLPSRCNPVTAPADCEAHRIERRRTTGSAHPDDPAPTETIEGRATRLVDASLTSLSTLLAREP